MTWAEFVEAVESHLAVEANRRGMEGFRLRYMKNAVLDLQRYIRGYREANTTVYTAAQLETQGQAQLVALPTGAKPKALYIYSVDADLDDPLCYRHRLQFYPWLNRQDLICGGLSFGSWWGGCCTTAGCPPVTLTADQEQAFFSKAYVYTIGPMGRNALIYPQVTDSTRLLLVWDGFKYIWNDADLINFPEEASEAVAAYVQARIAKNVDKNLQLAREYETDYVKLRLSLWRDFQETLEADGEDQEYDSTQIPFPMPLVNFGAQTTPFLSAITTIAGSAATALEAIPTTSVDTPTVVLLLISGVWQVWMLDAGTTATGPGVQRPSDYNSTTNAKVWIQMS